MHIGMIYKSLMFSLQVSTATRCCCQPYSSACLLLCACLLPQNSLIYQFRLVLERNSYPRVLATACKHCVQALPLAGIARYQVRLTMQSLHTVSCVGAKSAAAFRTPRLQCYVSFAHRMRAGAAAVTSSIRVRSRPTVGAAAGSVETATQPSADTAHLGRVLRICSDLRTPKPSMVPCASYILRPFHVDHISFFGVHHVGILVQDLGRSKEFYCDTLGK